MNNNNCLNKNQGLLKEQLFYGSAVPKKGGHTADFCPYLTNTDKSRSNVPFTDKMAKVMEIMTRPLTPEEQKEEQRLLFQQKSMDLFDEVKDLFYFDDKALRHLVLMGFIRFRKINNNEIVIYRNFNRLGNSNAGYGLACQNSDSDKARFASKQLARERALANIDVWQYFATLTFDAAKQDRNDFHKLLSRVTCFLRRRDVRYFIVAELHKKGGIHFHCLLSEELGPYLSEFKDTAPKALKNSYIKGELEKGRHLMNCKDLADTYGYVIVEPIRNSEACVNYMTKYVLKTFDSDDFTRISRRRFFISKGLKAPEIVPSSKLKSLDLEDFDLMAVSSFTEKIVVKRRSVDTCFNLGSFDERPLIRHNPPSFSIKQEQGCSSVI